MADGQAPRPTRFNFDTVFMASGSGTATGRQSLRSAYSADEVEQIREEMFAKGRAAAIQEATSAQAAALISITQAMGTLISQFDQNVHALRNESVGLALAVARRLADAALRVHPEQEIEDLLAECMHKMHIEPRLVVSVPPALLDAVRASIDSVGDRNGYSGRVVVLADPALRGSACRVEWADGGIERDVNTVFMGIEEHVARWSAHPKGEGH